LAKHLTATATWGASDPTVAMLSNALGSQGLATSVARGGPFTVIATVAAVVTVTALGLSGSVSVGP
jgi:hypothetical protein